MNVDADLLAEHERPEDARAMARRLAALAAEAGDEVRIVDLSDGGQAA